MPRRIPLLFWRTLSSLALPELVAPPIAAAVVIGAVVFLLRRHRQTKSRAPAEPA